jgi:hypothetical protein
MAELRAEVLSLATEDRFGLYEVVWRLNALHPEASAAQKVEAAQLAMADLLDAGLVEICFGTGSACEALPRLESRQAVADPGAWASPHGTDGRLYTFSATPRGEREYFRQTGPV